MSHDFIKEVDKLRRILFEFEHSAIDFRIEIFAKRIAAIM